MIVDRRKDTYDELMVLSRDATTSRRRRQFVSNLVIGGAVVASGIFVAASSAHMDNLDSAQRAAAAERDVARQELAAARNQIAVLTSERDIYRRNANWFANISPQLELSDAVRRLNFVVSGDGETVIREERLSNVVWVVDGSRRFPITDGDILWIPEGNFWVQLESESDSDPADPIAEAGSDRKVRQVTFYYDGRPTDDATGGVRRYLGGSNRYYEELGRWAPGTHGTANCVQLTLHYSSRRPGFADEKYLDMEVVLYRSTAGDSLGVCPAGGRTVADGEVETWPEN